MIAAITAGGLVDAAFSHEIGTPVKALAPLGAGRLIDHTVNAARASGASRIAVFGNAQVRAHCADRVETVIEAAKDGRANLEAALRCAGENEALLLLTSDLPFITQADLVDFLERIDGAEIAMPIARADSYIAAYPNAADHATTLGPERVVNGSVFYFSPGTAPRVIAVARELFAARKSLPRMAMLLDLLLLFAWVFRRLRIEHIEAYAQRVWNVRARAVRDASPGLCYDIDTLDDYRYARRILG
jgi:GTP:adenosylcobinamide-phosphate guanylyltransferase